jgi:hypothetical protein
MKRDDGSLLMEAVVCLPVLLVLILGCMQIAHIWFARQIVQYAAYSASRALLVIPDEEQERALKPGGSAFKAASYVCAWIALSQPRGSREVEVPGWGAVPGSGGMEEKLELNLEHPAGKWDPMVTVKFDFPLVMPVAGHLIGWGVNPWADKREWRKQHADATGDKHSGETMQYPYIRFEESVSLVKPYILLPFKADGE